MNHNLSHDIYYFQKAVGNKIVDFHERAEKM